jgi:hypothetical protein
MKDLKNKIYTIFNEAEAKILIDLNEVYKNNRTSIKFVCKNGHINITNWLNVNKSGVFCSRCKEEKFFARIKKLSENEGYKILSDKYTNSKIKLDFICPENHRFSMIWNSFSNGNRCPVCSDRERVTKDKVINKLIKYGYRFVSGDIKNNRSIFKVICSNGHIWSTSWSKFISGVRCKRCVCESTRKNIDEVRVEFNKEGYKLLSNKYNGSDIKLDFECTNGHIGKISWNKFQQGKRCAECYGNKKLTLDYVKRQFEKEGYIFLSSTYENNDIPLDFICDNGHKSKMPWSDFQSGRRCYKCSTSVSKRSQEWLDSVGIPEEFREYKLKYKSRGFSVDGFSFPAEVYEFLGDYWHGNLNKFDPDGINSRVKKTFKQLNEETFNRLNLLSDKYKVFYIWESDWLKGGKCQKFSKHSWNL